MKRCPYCVEKMQDVAVVCPHCGRDYPQSESEDRVAMLATVKSDTGWRYLIYGILVMVLIASGWLYWLYSSRNTTLAINGYQQTIATQKAELEQARLFIPAEGITPGPTAAVQIPTLDAQIYQQATQQATQISGLEAQVLDLQKNSQRVCQGYGTVKFDYTNNETLFAQLKEYAKGLGGNITKSTYILPWNDPAIAIYTINTEMDKKPYTFIFIGYFESTKFNLKNAIYWIGNDCYLDRQ